MNVLQGMDRYLKEVLQVSSLKNDIKVQYCRKFNCFLKQERFILIQNITPYLGIVLIISKVYNWSMTLEIICATFSGI